MVDFPEYYFAIEDENDGDLVRYDVVDEDGVIAASWLLNPNFNVVESKPPHLKENKMEFKRFDEVKKMIKALQEESPRRAYVATRNVNDSLDSASTLLNAHYPDHTPADAIALTKLLLQEMRNFKEGD